MVYYLACDYRYIKYHIKINWRLRNNRKKVSIDYYIQNAGYIIELRIIINTILVIIDMRY